MRIIALVTQKGGSGKSTIASSLAVAAAETGETVIVVDMDQADRTVRSRMPGSVSRASDFAGLKPPTTGAGGPAGHGTRGGPAP